MLRTHWLCSPSAAKSYFSQADYYASSPGEWLGIGAKMLGLEGETKYEDFEKLCDNINPLTGELLRPNARDEGRVGMDLTFNSVKSVGIARELAGEDNVGDPKIEEAHREAVRYAMGYVEADMQTRVRVGGADHDRDTGNMIACHFTHRDTRISAEDQMPDMSLHSHVFVMNATFDPVEQKWKAAQMGDIKHDAPFYEAIYHNRLASNLKELGYGIRRDGKAFEIAGVSRDLIEKFSRRSEYIKSVAAKLGITKPETLEKLGATTRLGKAKELADDLNGYYVSRLTGKEREQLGNLEGKPSYESNEKKAVEFAIGHLFERKSVVDERRLYETAIRHGIGSVTPEGVQDEAKKQGLMVRGDEATTKTVLAEEGRVVAFAREGRGTCRPMGARPSNQVEAGAPLELGWVAAGNSQPIREFSETERHAEGTGHVGLNLATPSALAQPKFDLSPEQLQIARHVWDSPDRVILIRGAAGTGKTHTMKATIAGLDRPVVVLAPSADASRGVLRKEGFAEADTVARFLMDEKFQETAKGGVIWVDEAGLLGIRQVREVFDLADKLDARVVLQGDKRQHASVERGATLRVLEQFAGLPVAELKDIRRQKGRYKEAVESLSKGDFLDGYDTLDDLGWVKQTPVFDHNKLLVADYMAAVDTKRSDQEVTDRVLVVAPTHIEGDEITADIRTKLKERGIVSKDDRTFETLRPLGWTEAERGDVEKFDGTEIIQWHRNSGTHRAGDKVEVGDFNPGKPLGRPQHYSVYSRTELALAAGDRIRITSNGKTKDGDHKLNNGSQYTVKGFTKEGDIELTNKWVIAKGFDHVTHGYVATSHASQGKTVDRVLIAMGHESRPAMNSEQFYVSVSRGRDAATIYTDLNAVTLREAIQKSDPRKSATELMGREKRKPKRREKVLNFMAKIRRVAKALRERVANAIEGKTNIKELEYERVR